jgi:aquaporin Z
MGEVEMGGSPNAFTRPQTYQALLAEAVGTGLLTLAALLAGTPYAVALILAALVYALGPISGAHLNPAVTLGLLAARRLPVATGAAYIVAQAAGALLAGTIAPSIGAAGAANAGRPVGEFVGAGLLVLTVAAVSDKWVPQAGGGVAIGAALGAGLLLSGGVLNPAVALALGLGISPALWAAALGGIAFAALFDLLSVTQGEGEEQAEAEQRPARAAQPVAVALPRPSTSSTNASHSAQAGFAPARSSIARSRTARSGGASRSSSGAARVSSTLARSLWSSVIGMAALPFALLGAVWRASHRARHTGANARRVPPAPPVGAGRLDWD